MFTNNNSNAANQGTQPKSVFGGNSLFGGGSTSTTTGNAGIFSQNNSNSGGGIFAKKQGASVFPGSSGSSSASTGMQLFGGKPKNEPKIFGQIPGYSEQKKNLLTQYGDKKKAENQSKNQGGQGLTSTPSFGQIGKANPQTNTIFGGKIDEQKQQLNLNNNVSNATVTSSTPASQAPTGANTGVNLFNNNNKSQADSNKNLFNMDGVKADPKANQFENKEAAKGAGFLDTSKQNNTTKQTTTQSSTPTPTFGLFANNANTPTPMTNANIATISTGNNPATSGQPQKKAQLGGGLFKQPGSSEGNTLSGKLFQNNDNSKNTTAPVTDARNDQNQPINLFNRNMQQTKVSPNGTVTDNAPKSPNNASLGNNSGSGNNLNANTGPPQLSSQQSQLQKLSQQYERTNKSVSDYLDEWKKMEADCYREINNQINLTRQYLRHREQDYIISRNFATFEPQINTSKGRIEDVMAKIQRKQDKMIYMLGTIKSELGEDINPRFLRENQIAHQIQGCQQIRKEVDAQEQRYAGDVDLDPSNEQLRNIFVNLDLVENQIRRLNHIVEHYFGKSGRQQY